MWDYDGLGNAYHSNGDAMYINVINVEYVEVRQFSAETGMDTLFRVYSSIPDAMDCVATFVETQNNQISYQSTLLF